MPSGVLTPGTTSKGMPASASASASSPPRPKMNGSPPLSRTTVRPRRARSISRRRISSWQYGMVGLLLAHVEPLGGGRRQIEQRGRGQVIVEDAVGERQNFAAFQGEEVGIAGTGAHQVDLAHEQYAARAAVRAAWRRASRPMAAASSADPSDSARDERGAVRRRDNADEAQPAARPPRRARRWGPGSRRRARRARARSAVTAARVSAWSSGAAAAKPALSGRVSMASAPCPTAGHITSGGRISAMRSSHPSRFSPAAASTMASYCPSRQLAQARIEVAAHGFDGEVRPQLAQLRGAAQRTGAHLRALRAASASVQPTMASRGSSRGGTAASTRPAGSSVGRSFRLCTARSARPSSSASSISLVKRPLVRRPWRAARR